MRLTRGCRAGGGVACSSLEYGGIRAATKRTPAPHRPTTTPDVASSASSRPPRPSPFHPALSRSHLPVYSPPGTSAQSCSSLLSLPRILRRLRADNSGDDDVPISLRRILPARRTFGKGIGRMDRRKEQKARRRKIVFTFPG